MYNVVVHRPILSDQIPFGFGVTVGIVCDVLICGVAPPRHFLHDTRKNAGEKRLTFSSSIAQRQRRFRCSHDEVLMHQIKPAKALLSIARKIHSLHSEAARSNHKRQKALTQK